MKTIKVILERRSDEVWQITNFVNLASFPSDGHDPDFYPVGHDLALARPNYLHTTHSSLAQSIVPIVAILPGESIVRCLGTGFFISSTGYLLTAAHVIHAPIDRKFPGVHQVAEQVFSMGDLQLGVMVATNPLTEGEAFRFSRIEWAGFLAAPAESPLPIRGLDLKITSDTAVCKVEERPLGFEPLSIIQPGIKGVGIAVGKRATAIGYSGMHDIVTEGSEKVRVGDFPFNLHISKGLILERFPDNFKKREVYAPGACFSASMMFPAGMSGSPIFDDEGIYVHGVVSMGREEESGPVKFGYGSMLASVLQLPMIQPGNKSLLQLLDEGVHGIPHLVISGA